MAPRDRVWVVIEGFALEGSVELNGRAVGPLEGNRTEVRLEVTGHLEMHNELAILVQSTGPGGDSRDALEPAEVSLEIQSP